MFLKLRHPVSAIREPFGTAGLIVACVALIAALAGGAYAAGGGLTAKQKKEVKKIAKQFAGKPGAAGPQGPAGTNGTNGTNGKDGATGPQGPIGPQGSAGAKGTFSTEPLPSGETLTGMWSVSGPESAVATISFPIRVSPAPITLYTTALSGFTIAFQLNDGTVTPYHFTYPPFPSEEELEEAQEAYEEACLAGTFDEPEAAPGFLCIYRGPGEEANGPNPVTTNTEAAHEFGTNIPFNMGSGHATQLGSWAVTG